MCVCVFSLFVFFDTRLLIYWWVYGYTILSRTHMHTYTNTDTFRNPFIGYNVKAYGITIHTDENKSIFTTTQQQQQQQQQQPIEVVDQRTLLPSLRHATTGTRIRPVDVKTSPVGDGALLMTADRDDLYNGVGGLYRIRGENGTPSAAALDQIDLEKVNTLGDNVSWIYMFGFCFCLGYVFLIIIIV